MCPPRLPAQEGFSCSGRYHRGHRGSERSASLQEAHSAMGELLIRSATANDVPAMTEIYNHYVVTSHATFDITPVSLENRHSWFNGFSQAGPFRLKPLNHE